MATSTIPTTMRASQWTTATGGLDKNLTVNPAAALPKTANNLPANWTLVKVAYSSLNPIDYKVPESVGAYLITKPGVPSLDFSGTVVDTKRTDIKAGQHVFGKTEPVAFGACAEYLVVGPDACVPLPDGVSLKDAACVGVAGLTAYQCIVPNLKAGGSVFINGGSGGTGTFGIQMAKAAGCQVTTTCSTANVELCKSLGADEVVDYRSVDVIKTLSEGGQKFDLIFDTVFASEAMYYASHAFLKEGGKYVTIAGSPSFGTLKHMSKALLVPGFLGGGKRPFKFHSAASKKEDYVAIAEWMKEGKVKPVIEEVYELEETDKAFAKLKSGRAKGKLVIKIMGEE